MQNKKWVLFPLLVFLAASCSFNKTNLPAGVFKSTNGGGDWLASNAVKDSKTDSIGSLSISKIDFEPGNPQILYAGSYTNGLYKSEDAGVSWKKILSKIYVYDFAVNPINSKIIYAAGYFADHGMVLKTEDGGSSWNEIYNEASTNNAVRALALNPANLSQLVIGTSSGSIIKSADGGLSWQLVKNYEDRVNRVLWQNGNVYVVLKSKGLYKSAGFADNFTEMTDSLNKTYNIAGASYSANTIDTFSQVFVDSISSSLIYLTTNKGLYKTVDEGKSWVLQRLPVKPNESETRAITIAKSSSNIVMTSVGATVYKSLDGGQTWQTQGLPAGGFVNFLLIHPQLPQIVYAGIYANQ